MKNLTLLFLSLLALLQSCAPAKLLQPPMQYQPGYTIAVRQKTDTETQLTIFGQNQIQNGLNTTEYTYALTDVLPGGRLKWEMQITRYTMENNDSQGSQQSYDTQDPDRDTTDMKSKMLDNMIGAKMHIITRADGQILEFSGANALFEKMMGAVKDKPEMAPMLKNIQRSFGDSAMIETVRNMWGDTPTKPVRVGATWKVTRNTSGFMNLQTKYQYKLKSRDDQKAEVTVKLKSQPAPGLPAELDMGAAKIRYDLKGEGSGYFFISQTDGLLREGKNTVKLKGMMHMRGDKIPAMDVPMQSETTITTEMKRLK